MLLMRSEGNQSLPPPLPDVATKHRRTFDRPPRHQRTPPRPADRLLPLRPPAAHYQMRSTRMDGVVRDDGGHLDRATVVPRKGKDPPHSTTGGREGGAIRPGKRGCSTAQPSLIFLRLRQTRHAHNNRRQRRRDRIKRDLFNGKIHSLHLAAGKRGLAYRKKVAYLFWASSTYLSRTTP